MEACIKEAEAVDTNKYTDETAAALKAALEEAKNILGDENISEADQNIVDEAAEKLASAVKGLTEKPSEPEDPDPEKPDPENPDPEDPDPENPGTQEPSENPSDGNGGSSRPGTGHGGAGEQADSAGDKAVKTGDTGATAMLWAVLGAVSAGTCVYVKRRRTR